MKKRKTYPKNQSSIYAAAKRYVVQRDIGLHWHDCCEIELVLAGCGTHSINGNSYAIEPGNLYLFTPSDCHSITMDEPIEVLSIMFEEELISEDLYTNVLALEMTGADLIAQLSPAQRISVKQYFSTILEELNSENKNPHISAYIEHLLNCIVIELLRGIPNTSSRTTDKQLMKEAILYLHHHYAEPITLTSLATHLHLTSSYLSTYFKANIGRSFKDYLIELRLRHACRLLVNTDLSVTDICFNCGFSSYSHFMRTFRAHYNTSPLQFRHQHGKSSVDRL